jgi:type IV pilus assembly protein PilA
MHQTGSLSRGFTLLELMIVIAILGILLSVALPAYSDYTVRAQVAEGISMVGELKPRIVEYQRARGRFPADNAAAGVAAPEHLIGNYVDRVEVVDGALQIRYGHRINDLARGAFLSIRPVYVRAAPDAPLSWICGRAEPVPGMVASGEDRTSLPDRFMPAACRGGYTVARAPDEAESTAENN